jgi:hypothetical protein
MAVLIFPVFPELSARTEYGCGMAGNPGRQNGPKTSCSQHSRMALRWATAVFLETEKHFQRIGGYKKHLWMLKSYLDELENEQTLAEKRKTG